MTAPADTNAEQAARRVIKLADYPHEIWHARARLNKPDWSLEEIHEQWTIWCALPTRRPHSD